MSLRAYLATSRRGRWLAISLGVIALFWLWVSIVTASPSHNVVYIVVTEILYFAFAIGVPVVTSGSLVSAVVSAIRNRDQRRRALLECLIAVAVLLVWGWSGARGGVEGL